MAISVVDGFKITNNAPVDDRLTYDTKANALAGISAARRYDGLPIWITAEKKQYRFKGGIADANLTLDSIQDVTYSTLTAMISGGLLTPGQSYRITDFQTIHAIPAQAGLQLTETIPINTTPVDPIIVTAQYTNLLCREAFQPSNPNDKIIYDVTDAFCEDTTTPRPGAIAYRWDTAWNVSAFYDWKQCKFRRYKLDTTLYTAWNGATAYVRYNLALQSNALWVCNVAHTNQTPSNSNNYWTKVLDFVDTMYHLYKKSWNFTNFTLTADAAAFKDFYTFHNNTGDVLLSSVRNVHIGNLSKDTYGSAVRSYNNIVFQHPNSSSLCCDNYVHDDCADMNFICTTTANSFLGNVFEPLTGDIIGRNMNGNHFWARAGFFIVGTISSRIIGTGLKVVIGDNANTITMQFCNSTHFVGGSTTNVNLTGQLVGCTVGGGTARMFVERPVGSVHLLGSMGTGTHIGCHNGVYILTQSASRLSSTDTTIDISFPIVFTGAAGGGAVGIFNLLDSLVVPANYSIGDVFLKTAGLTSLGGILNLGFTGQATCILDNTSGNVATIGSGVFKLSPAFIISNSDTNVIILSVSGADVTAGTLTVTIRLVRT